MESNPTTQIKHIWQPPIKHVAMPIETNAITLRITRPQALRIDQQTHQTTPQHVMTNRPKHNAQSWCMDVWCLLTLANSRRRCIERLLIQSDNSSASSINSQNQAFSNSKTWPVQAAFKRPLSTFYYSQTHLMTLDGTLDADAFQ